MGRICEIEGCSRTYLAKGMCSPCYHRARKEEMSKLPCSILACVKPLHQAGLCHSHYHRQYTHGDPFAGRTPDGERLQWLTAQVTRCLAESTQNCVSTPFGTDSGGYGEVILPEKKRLRMHVASVILSGRTGPEKGQVVRHLCGNSLCVNPHHLTVGTPKENHADSVRHGTAVRGERTKQSKLTESQVLEIRASNETQKVLGERYGVDPSHISVIRSGKAWKHLLPEVEESDTPEASRRNTLTSADVLEIRASTDRIKDLAARFNVSRAQIHRIRSGRSWRHLLPQDDPS